MPPTASIPRREPALTAVWLILPVIVALVWVRALTPISPDIYWDVDPRSSLARDVPVTVIGPTLLAWLNTASILAAALALLAHLFAGGAMRWGVAALAAAGSVACFLHMPAHADNLHRGAAWLAAIWLGVAVAHLARWPGIRRFLAATVISAGICFAINALWYTAVEHPATVQSFLAHEEERLHGFGWEFGSPQHLVFRRRVLSPEATGAFGLSNVLGSMAAAGAAAAFAGAWAAFLKRRRFPLVVSLACGVAGTLAVALTHSKGAAAALLMAMALLALLMFMRLPAMQRRPALLRLLPTLIPLLSLLAVGAVALRGAAGLPDTAEGERSLLFRAQYNAGAERILAGDVPPGVTNRLLGVGPAGFQSLFPLIKSPHCPEDVASTHNFAIDWLVMLGIGGAAWALWLVWQSACAGASVARVMAEELNATTLQEGTYSRGVFNAALAAVGIGFGIDFAVRSAALDDITRLLWIAQAALMVLGITLLASPGGLDELGTRAALWMAAAVLIVHGQIEMTFFHWGSAVLAVVIVAASGCDVSHAPVDFTPLKRAAVGRRLGLFVPLLLIGVTLGLMTGYVIPVSRQQDALADAADAIRLEPPDRDEVDRLLLSAYNSLPSDPRVFVRIVGTRTERASEALARDDKPAARQAVEEAMVFISQTLKNQAVLDDLASRRITAQAMELAAMAGTEESDLHHAAAAWRRVIDRAPYGLLDRVRYADLLWRLGDVATAKQFDEETLRYNDMAYLDPAAQLPAKVRDMVRARLVGSE